MALSWGQSMGSATTIVAADTLRADETLHFRTPNGSIYSREAEILWLHARMGSSYRICFSANSTFGSSHASCPFRFMSRS